MHNIFNASKSYATTMWNFISNTNPYLNWYTDFWKDYFIDGWYIPATGEAARRYYSARQCELSGVLQVAT
jgi:hypothetical protein